MGNKRATDGTESRRTRTSSSSATEPNPERRRTPPNSRRGLRNRRSQVRILSGALLDSGDPPAKAEDSRPGTASVRMRIGQRSWRWAAKNHRTDHRTSRHRSRPRTIAHGFDRVKPPLCMESSGLRWAPAARPKRQRAGPTRPRLLRMETKSFLALLLLARVTPTGPRAARTT
jgi:hypothetical protein